MQAQEVLHPSRALFPRATAGVLSLAAAAAGAQEVAPNAKALEARSLLTESFGLSEHGGRLLGAGHDYQAAFEPGRFVYTPALGRTAPTSAPVSFTLQEVRLGDTVLLAVDAPVAPMRDGNLVVYPHAGGIEERYEVRADGVHQTFRFASLPAGGGDLVVRGHLSTDLGREACGVGARFLWPGVGGVSWGSVTGIDALGAAAQGEVRLDGADLLLVLPADFVAQASLPLVLDPLVGTIYDGIVGTNDDTDPDAAFDATNKVYLVVWERWFAEDNAAVRAQRFSAGGSPLGSLITVATNPSLTDDFYAEDPSVASINASNRFLVAWKQSSSAAPPARIYSAAIDADDGGLSPAFQVSPSIYAQHSPAVGGERTLVDNDGLIVWAEATQGIRLRQVTVATTGAPTGTTAAITLEAESAGYLKKFPAISRSGGDAGRFLVAWERTDASGISAIEARAVSRNGEPLGTDLLVSGTGESSNNAPAVDGDGERWVVAFERQEGFVPSKDDLLTRALFWNGTALEFQSEPNWLEADIDDHEFGPSVSWTGASALVAYCDAVGGATEVYAKAVDPFTCADCESEMLVQHTVSGSLYTATASEWSGGPGTGALDNAWIVFSSFPFGTVDPDVLVVHYDQPDQPTDLGGGCDGGGLQFNPCAFEGNKDFRAQLVGAASNAPTFWVVSPLAESFVSGPCTWTPKFLPGTVIIPRLTDNDGDASAQAPIPVPSAGLTVYTQWATLHAGGASPLLGGVSFSNSLEVTINP